MIELYADDRLIYNSRTDTRRLLGLKTTTGLNKGGTAEIILPPDHPAYNDFISYRTVVTLYENGVLRFRGRVLYPSDDFYNRRTITCEGERCFFQDSVIRPYLYQDEPAAIFADALRLYNASVDEFKRFTLGTVTVTDPNDYVRLESTNAETFASFFDKLVERCGGYITFSDDGKGGRAVNWLENVGRDNNQPIEFGENLLDFTRSGQSPDLATALLPYGAQLEDGTRVTIESVNGGVDYIKDDAAVALRGFIMKTETWDDVTEPANLLTKARQWLAEHKLAVTSLQLTAADLSRIDRTLDSFLDGDRVPVKSTPHSLDDTFQLTDREVDWLNPGGSGITLGKTQASLTGADVIYKRQANKATERTKTEAVGEAVKLNAAQMKEIEESMYSKIEQLAGSITMTVNGGLGGKASIQLTVDGSVASAQELDLSGVRAAFANDTTAVTVSAGTITFNSGTLIINSSKCQLTAAGKLTVEDAVVNGEIITIDGSYKTELNDGSLKLYYANALCGTINTKYWSGASTEGISLRIEEAGSYIMFSHPSDAGTGSDVDYYLNYGWDDYYKERHIFQTSARFLDDVWLQRAYHRALYLVNGDGTFLVAVNSNGTGLTVSKI